MRVKKTISSKDILCNYCQNDFAICPKANHIKFGDGVGSDNVTECSEFDRKSYFGNYPIEGSNTFSTRIDLNNPNIG